MPHDNSDHDSPAAGTVRVPAHPSRSVPAKFHLLARLGEGGNGVVYRAFDTVLQRAVAIKLLPRHHAGNEIAGARFLREARAAAGINHPHVVAVHAIEEHDGEWLLVMEYLPGGSAEDRLRAAGRLAWREATRIVRDACRGLAQAHAVGLIHRDIKPSNILLTADGLAKLADFGLAKNPAEVNRALTQPGSVVGTPLFMSPEQCRNEPLDERSDLYSLGATYFNLLTGRPPFDAAGVGLFIAHCTQRAPDPRSLAGDVPPACAAIVLRALAKEPADRYSTAHALLADLDAVLGPQAAEAAPPGTAQPGAPVAQQEIATRQAPALPRPARRRRWLAGLAVGGLLLLAPLLYLVFHPPGANRTTRPPAPTWPESPLEVGGFVEAVALSHDADHPILAWVVSFPNATSRLTVWDFAQGKVRWQRDLSATVRTLALTSDGARLALGGNGKDQVEVLDSLSGERTAQMKLPDACFRTLAFAPDNRTLAVAIDPARVLLYDARSGRPLPHRPEVPGQAGPVRALAFAPDGQTLALALADGRTLLWEAGSWTVKYTLRVPRGHVYALAFSPDGSCLAGAVAQGGAVVHLWRPDSGALLGTLRGHRKEVFALAFSPNGTLASADGSHILLWDVGTRQQRGEPLTGHRPYVIRALAFAADGKTLFSGGFDQALRHWDVAAQLDP